MIDPGKKRLLLKLVVLAAAIWIGYCLWRDAFGRRVVGRAVASDGTKVYVVQNREWMSLFAGKGRKYTTMFYVHKPSGTWRGYYGVFEDERWNNWNCTATVSQEKVVFYRNQAPEITFFWKTEKYILHPQPGYDGGGPFEVDRIPVKE